MARTRRGFHWCRVAAAASFVGLVLFLSSGNGGKQPRSSSFSWAQRLTSSLRLRYASFDTADTASSESAAVSPSGNAPHPSRALALPRSNAACPYAGHVESAKYAGRVTSALSIQAKVIAKFTPARQPSDASQIAPPELPLPDACYDDLGFHVDRDMDCFSSVASHTCDELFPPHTPLCWGYSGRNETQEPLVFHTLVLTPAIPHQTPILLWSFLATQCCDAMINVWLAPAAYKNSSRPVMDIPAPHAHRIVYRLYDAAAEWAAVKGDFPEFLHNQSAVTAMTAMPDLRYHSDWARMVIMYAHGGTWIDLDTVFLRDMRMVFAFQPFMYRAGVILLPNNAVFRLGKRPNAMSQRIMDLALRGRHPGPIPAFYNLGMPLMGSAAGLQYLSEALFDFSWFRFADSELPAMASVHPEFKKSKNLGDNWDAFFRRTAESDVELESWRATPFMPGSLTYHWHGSFGDRGRYKMGLPPRAWPGVLVARYEALAREKAAVCAAA